MASRPFHKPIKAPSKLFGLVKESASPDDPLTIDEDTTAWEIYNHKASEVDRELIKDWNDNLNTLLIFVSILLRCFDINTQCNRQPYIPGF
jgi:hypothetical protein